MLRCESLQSYTFQAERESTREPRIVRIGLIQNSISLPTTASILEQKKALMERVKPMIDAAGACGVNILCLQVSFKMMPFVLPKKKIMPFEFSSSLLRH